MVGSISLFPYDVGYIGELTTFTQSVGRDLAVLMHQLDINYEIAELDEAAVMTALDTPDFRQFIAVEMLNGRPAVVATANLSKLAVCYDPSGIVTDSPTFWLGSFVVHSDCRGTGVAQRLWGKLLEYAAQQMVTSIQFTSRPSRAAAHAFYAKMGAVQLGPVMAYVSRDVTPRAATTALPAHGPVYELRAGQLSLVLSQQDDPQLAQPLVEAIAATDGTRCVEQIVPLTHTTEGCTVLFRAPIA